MIERINKRSHHANQDSFAFCTCQVAYLHCTIKFTLYLFDINIQRQISCINFITCPGYTCKPPSSYPCFKILILERFSVLLKTKTGQAIYLTIWSRAYWNLNQNKSNCLITFATQTAENHSNCQLNSVKNLFRSTCAAITRCSSAKSPSGY